jgi:hypothetical protein
MVKLFVSDHWDGFGWSWTHLWDLLYVAALALVFWMIFLRFSMMMMVSTEVGLENTQAASPATLLSSRLRRRSAQARWAATYMACVVGFYVPCRLMGRQTLVNILEPKQFHLDPIGETAGTVGVAFPAASLPHLRQYLIEQLRVSGKHLAPIDVLLNQWIDESNSFRAVRSTPSMIQHLGAYSSAARKNQGNFQEMKQDSAFVF